MHGGDRGDRQWRSMRTESEAGWNEGHSARRLAGWSMMEVGGGRGYKQKTNMETEANNQWQEHARGGPSVEPEDHDQRVEHEDTGFSSWSDCLAGGSPRPSCGCNFIQMLSAQLNPQKLMGPPEALCVLGEADFVAQSYSWGLKQGAFEASPSVKYRSVGFEIGAETCVAFERTAGLASVVTH